MYPLMDEQVSIDIYPHSLTPIYDISFGSSTDNARDNDVCLIISSNMIQVNRKKKCLF